MVIWLVYFFLWLHYNGFIPSPHAFWGGLHHVCPQWFSGLLPAPNGPAICPWSTPVPAYVMEWMWARTKGEKESFLQLNPCRSPPSPPLAGDEDWLSPRIPFSFLLIFPGYFFSFYFFSVPLFCLKKKNCTLKKEKGKKWTRAARGDLRLKPEFIPMYSC